MKTLRNFVVSAALSLTAITSAPAADFLIVVDSSGSMSEPNAEGQSKMNAAKAALQSLKSDLSAHEVGLTLFGHRLDPNLPGSCQDVETVLPISDFIEPEFDRHISALKPKGNTPLAEALGHAAQQLVTRDQKETKIVVVLTDGNENCGGDPVAVAQQMQSLGINVRIHVVGLGVTPQEQAQLKRLAEAGNGEFGLAKTKSELEGLIRKQVAPTPPRAVSTKSAPAELNPLQKALVARLEDGDRNVRTTAANNLLKMKAVAAAPFLVERLQVDGDHYYAWPAALAALQGLRPDLVDDALTRAVGSTNEHISVSAINACVQREDRSSKTSLSKMDQALVKALEADHRNIRSAAAAALEARETHAAVDALAQRILVETDEYYAWPAAIKALHKLESDVAMTAVLQAMESDNAKIRDMATQYAVNLN